MGFLLFFPLTKKLSVISIKPYLTQRIPFCFSANDYENCVGVNLLGLVLNDYYRARFVNLNLLESLLHCEKCGEPYDRFLRCNATDIQRLYDHRKVFDSIPIINLNSSIVENVNPPLAESPVKDINLFDIILLAISDQKLIIHFILKEKDEIISLINETLPICERNQYLVGKDFREFLKTIDLSANFSSSDIEKVYAFAHDYIWI